MVLPREHVVLHNWKVRGINNTLLQRSPQNAVATFTVKTQKGYRIRSRYPSGDFREDKSALQAILALEQAGEGRATAPGGGVIVEVWGVVVVVAQVRAEYM